MSLETIDYERFPIRPGERVLDIGCGEGRHAIAAYVRAEAEVVAMDLDAGELATTREKFAAFDRGDHGLLLTCASALRLPFADGIFDKVICSEVLEHLPDYGSALREIRRVLAPQGRLAVSVPRFGPESVCWRLSQEYHCVEGGHVRIFRDSMLRQDVERLGLIFYGRHYAHGLHSPYWWLRCLFWSKGPEHPIVRAYHRLLVWDLLKAPRLTRWLERLLNPLIGKSVVMYFRGASPGNAA